MMRQFVKNLKDRLASRAAAAHRDVRISMAKVEAGTDERRETAVAKLNEKYRAEAAARRVERKKRRASWQTDPLDTHLHTLHPSVDRTDLPAVISIPRPTSAVITLLDGTKLRLFSDGSLRHSRIRRPDGVQTSSRRPSGVSGRQRRLQRRTLRAMVQRAVVARAAAATT